MNGSPVRDIRPLWCAEQSRMLGAARTRRESRFSPGIRADGRYVEFGSFATNRVPGDTSNANLFVHNRQAGSTSPIAAGEPGCGATNCPSQCVSFYHPGAAVTLTATPDSGWRFVGWEGACQGSGACTVTLTTDTQVRAVFRRQ